MNRHAKAAVLIFSFGMIASVCLGQTRDIPDPRALGREFQDALRSNHQAGGIVIVTETCEAKDVDPSPIALPPARTRLMQIDRASPNYFVTNTEVPNFLPKDYEPELLRSRVHRYLLDSNTSPAVALDGLLNVQELKAAVETSGLHKGLEVIIGIQPPPRKPEQPRRTESLESLTLRAALNEMAAFYGTGIWTYREVKDCGGQRLTRIEFTIY